MRARSFQSRLPVMIILSGGAVEGCLSSGRGNHTTAGRERCLSL